MKIDNTIVLSSTNLKCKESLIYFKIIGSNKKDILKLINDYEYVCRSIGIKGSINDVIYNIDGGEIWITYKYQDIAVFIIESLVNKLSIDLIIESASELKQEQWDDELKEKVSMLGVPIIDIDKNTRQIGYGVNSKIIKKDEWNTEVDLNLNNNGNIPIIAVTGTNGKTSTVKLIHKILCELGYISGVTSTGAIYVGNDIKVKGDTTGASSAKEVLSDRTVEVAVLETARGGMIKKGLGYKNNKVSVITSLSEDHLGLNGINSIEDLLKVKKLIIEELISDGKLVIEANYYLLKEFKHRNDVVIFNYCKNKYIKDCINEGKDVWYVDNGKVVHSIGKEQTILLDITEIPYTHYGISNGNVNNFLAALISVSTIHPNIEDICNVCKNIYCDLYTNPGRQNIIDIDGFKIILDYGHNEEAFREIFNLARGLNPTKVTGILSGPGDRSDDHLKTLGRVAGEFCDEIVIKQKFDMRGRNALEIALLIQQGVIDYNENFKDISMILDEEDALLYTLKKAKSGEVIVLITQHLEVIIPLINRYLDSKGLEKIIDDKLFI